MNTRRVKLKGLLWWVLPGSSTADLPQAVLSSGDEAQREHVQSLLETLE